MSKHSTESKENFEQKGILLMGVLGGYALGGFGMLAYFAYRGMMSVINHKKEIRAPGEKLKLSKMKTLEGLGKGVVRDRYR